MKNKMNDFLENLPQEKILLIEQLEEYTTLGQVIELLQIADSKISQVEETHNAKCLNPMPEQHYFVGKFTPEKVYLSYQNQIFYINWHMYFVENLQEHFSAKFANHILTLINSPTGIYLSKDFDEFYLVLGNEQVKQIQSQNIFELHQPILDNFDDINPIELKSSLLENQPIIEDILTRLSSFTMPTQQSLTSAQATQWLIEQKPFMQNLLEDETFLVESEADEKLRLIINAFVIIARQAIADPRVIDYKYREYPLLSELSFQKLISNLPKGKKVEQFLFSDNVLNAFIHHQKSDKTLDKIFKN